MNLNFKKNQFRLKMKYLFEVPTSDDLNLNEIGFWSKYIFLFTFIMLASITEELLQLLKLNSNGWAHTLE